MTNVAKIESKKLTDKQIVFINSYAANRDRRYSETEAGMKSGEGITLLARADIQAEIKRAGDTRMRTEVYAEAVAAILGVLRSTNEKGQTARVSAAKTVFEYVRMNDTPLEEKNIGEMSLKELRAAMGASHQDSDEFVSSINMSFEPATFDDEIDEEDLIRTLEDDDDDDDSEG